MSDPVAPSEPSSALVERIKRNDEGDQELRRASNIVQALVRDLPQTDDLLLTSESQREFRILRDRAPEIYLLFRGAIRQRAGAHVTQLLDAYIGPPSPGPRREVALLSIEDLMAQPATEWRTDRLFPTRGLGVIFGPPGSGKSFFAQAAACAIARGVPFFGRETKPGPVLCVCVEGRARDRVAAYMQTAELSHDQLPVKFVEQALDLCGSTSDLDQLEHHVREFSPVVIVIDTLNRVAAGSDENTAGDMGRLIGSFARLQEACDGLVLVIHHSGKDIERGARGHSSLRAAVDVEIEISRASDSDIRTARVSKLRDAEDGAEFVFRLESVALDEGRSSCIVVPATDAPKPVRAERGLSSNERLCLAALREELAATGHALPATSVIPQGCVAVDVEAWRQRFYARIGERVRSDGRRTVFSRAKDVLLDRKVVGCWESRAWIW